MSKKKIPGLPDFHIGNIFCIGRNYAEHARELKNEVPGQPLVFLKPTSSIIYDGQSISLPSQSSDVHHEVELVVCIGKGGKDIASENALEYVAGYGIGIDVTARDIQRKAKEKGHPWSVAKGFDTFAPLGNFVEAGEIGDPQNLDLSISVNGEQRQSDNTRLMLFPVAELVSYLSTIFSLRPGDLIFTGTPKGVSRIASGDIIEADLDNGRSHLKISVA